MGAASLTCCAFRQKEESLITEDLVQDAADEVSAKCVAFSGMPLSDEDRSRLKNFDTVVRQTAGALQQATAQNQKLLNEVDAMRSKHNLLVKENLELKQSLARQLQGNVTPKRELKQHMNREGSNNVSLDEDIKRLRKTEPDTITATEEFRRSGRCATPKDNQKTSIDCSPRGG